MVVQKFRKFLLLLYHGDQAHFDRNFEYREETYEINASILLRRHNRKARDGSAVPGLQLVKNLEVFRRAPPLRCASRLAYRGDRILPETPR